MLLLRYSHYLMVKGWIQLLNEDSWFSFSFVCTAEEPCELLQSLGTDQWPANERNYQLETCAKRDRWMFHKLGLVHFWVKQPEDRLNLNLLNILSQALRGTGSSSCLDQLKDILLERSHWLCSQVEYSIYYTCKSYYKLMHQG